MSVKVVYESEACDCCLTSFFLRAADLYDFGTWLAGSGSYSSCQPADVIW